MGAELAHFVTKPQAVGSGQDDTIPHEGVKEGALLYKGAELAHL